MDKTLVIMAAGMGSRYGGGIKQIEPVGMNGEIIMDFSIHDAIAAGFNKIVIIIRKDIEDDFNEVVGTRFSDVCKQHNVKLCFAYQNHPANNPELFPDGRKKPWGTGDAVLACGDIVKEPFAVINADDYYGRSAFLQAATLLDEGGYGMIGYHLGNTLSDNGAVTRGICSVEKGKLANIVETSNIMKSVSGAEADGKVLLLDAVVSMNFWCFPAEFIEVLEKEFHSFLADLKDPLKEEYLLPTIVGKLVTKGTEVKVCESKDKWFGVTYQEDKEHVVQEFKKLYDYGVYQKELYSDLE